MSGIKNLSKEMYDAMDYFEKTIKNTIFISSGFERENKELWSKRIYYCNGKVNEAFRVFLLGYTYGKSINE